MNKKPKLISDIRFYANSGRTEYGNIRFNHLETLYRVPYRSFLAVGDRFVCKLREHKFLLPGFDHVYVICTPALPSGVAEQSPLHHDARIRDVDVGLSPDRWNLLSDDAKYDHLVDLASAAIETFAVDTQVLNEVAAEVKRRQSLLEIVVKTKETKAYRVDVSYQNRPMQGPSVAYVSYTDKRTGRQGRAILTKLLSANDVYPLCGAIAVRNDTITISPRSSWRAATITQRYNVPMSVSVDAVLATCDERPT